MWEKSGTHDGYFAVPTFSYAVLLHVERNIIQLVTIRSDWMKISPKGMFL
jgi:hypothetical protein